MTEVTVKLTYFKATGKYYAEGEFTLPPCEVNVVWDEVKSQAAASRLPGVTSGQDFFVLVESNAENAHPRLFMPGLGRNIIKTDRDMGWPPSACYSCLSKDITVDGPEATCGACAAVMVP